MAGQGYSFGCRDIWNIHLTRHTNKSERSEAVNALADHSFELVFTSVELCRSIFSRLIFRHASSTSP